MRNPSECAAPLVSLGQSLPLQPLFSYLAAALESRKRALGLHLTGKSLPGSVFSHVIPALSTFLNPCTRCIQMSTNISLFPVSIVFKRESFFAGETGFPCSPSQKENR
jgi:hypothetical protein